MIDKILTKLYAFSSEQLIGIANKALNDREVVIAQAKQEKERLQIINSRFLARLAMTERERNEWKAEAERLTNLEIERKQNETK